MKKTARREQSRTVFVGLSGGVDSSVAAALLKERGFKVVGVHLKCWNIDGCAAQDAEDARRAAETLGIPFYVFDFEQEYRDRVVQYMVDGYKKGITPNPDVMCNQEIKFGLFYKRAMEFGADFVATGHYVKRVTRNMYRVSQGKRKGAKMLHATRYELHAARDASKDQSYFLWTLKQKQLAHCLFPLGDLIKRTEVRRLAKKYKLPNAEKKDSQGICFLGQVSLPEFLGKFIPNKKGAIMNVAGQKVGEHQGAYYYTIGQRRGLGVGGSPVPLYVADKNVKKNTITVAPEGDDALLRKEVVLSDINLINRLTDNRLTVFVRIRYRQPLFRARLYKLQPTTYKLVFDKPEKFVAPGQSAVLYDKKGKMLGGGIIQKAS